MKPLQAAAQRHVHIAQRVADAHRGIGDASLLALVSGSTVDDLDELLLRHNPDTPSTSWPKTC